MSKLPSMPLWVDDYIADTHHLTVEESGAYLLILMHMWKGNGFIRNDDREIANRLRLQPRHWLRLKPRLMPFFMVVGAQLSQKRLQKEFNYCVEFRNKQSAKAKRGVAIRNERKQILSFSRGSATAPAAGSAARGAATPATPPATPPAGSQPDASTLKKDIITSLQDTAREEPREPPEDNSNGGGPATALPTGAPSRPEPEHSAEPEFNPNHPLLRTGLMQGRTPFLPKTGKHRA